MSVFNKVQNYKRFEWFPMQGVIDPATDGKLKITPDYNKPDVFFTLDESAINEDFVHPIYAKSCADSANPQFEFQVKKGANVDLHYKGLKHSFKLDPANERNFYIDTKNEKLVYLDKQQACDGGGTCASSITEDPCAAYVIAAYENCCHNNNDPGNLYGLVACNQNWHIDNCCP